MANRKSGFKANLLVVAVFVTAGAMSAQFAPRVSAGSVEGDSDSRFARVDGIRVHYKSVGKGREALVFVHGWTCDMSFWRDQAAGLAGTARVILVDLPGHGLSDKPQITYTMDLFARAIDAVLNDAGVDR